MSNHAFGHLVQHAFKEAKQLPSPKPGKNPFLAFIAGVLFGPFGTGLYLRTLPDFFVPLALVLIGSFATVGIGAPVFWILCGAWGAVRANHANSQQS